MIPVPSIAGAPALATTAVIGCVVMLASAEMALRRLTHVARVYRLSPGLVGLLGALAGDAPEVATALVAMAGGSAAVAVGVVLGSDLFNLAAVLGVPALWFGLVQARTYGLSLNGGAALIATALVGLLIYPANPSPLVILPLLVLGLLVGTALALGSRVLRRVVGARLTAVITRQELEEAAAEAEQIDPEPLVNPVRWYDWLAVALALGMVAVGAELTLRGSLGLASSWHVPHFLLSTFVLPIVTSLPNAYVAFRLVQGGRPAAAVSSLFNSNLINLLVGLGLPVILFGGPRVSSMVRLLDYPALMILTIFTLVAMLPRRSMGRVGGSALILLYLTYAAGRIALSVAS